MKAKEYAEKYGNLLVNAANKEALNAAIETLYSALLDDMKDVCEKRHICKRPAYIALIKEFNQKANVINSLLPRPVFVDDWFAIQYSKDSERYIKDHDDEGAIAFTLDEMKGRAHK